MPITLQQDSEQSLIGLTGAIDIACAAELKTQLLQALQSSKTVRVSLEEATDVDVTTVQLLWAGARQAKGSGVDFALAGAVPESVSTVMSDAGFESLSVLVGHK